MILLLNMSLVKFERIVSVSSEDPAFPADNLLKSNYSDKKWKCKLPGEKQISVVIQMDSAAIISAIDVGNYGSAFIEVFVGKSSSPDDLKVLIVASSLMTLQEAKLGENMTNVRFFKDDSLVKPVALEKWDRIKLVCSQPYNKFIQYGLSFVVIHSKNVSSENGIQKLGKFFLKPKYETDDISVGSLFAKRKIFPIVELKGAAAIRAASSSGIISQKKNSSSVDICASNVQEENNFCVEAKNPNSENNPTCVLRKDNRKKKKIETLKTPKVTQNVNNRPQAQDGPSGILNGRSAKRTKKASNEETQKIIIRNKCQVKPFNQLMEGVVFTISGFQNPYRSDLRSKAIAMGAKYKPDWDNNCTHLLCAFPNTPKFNQVLGHGKIVTKEWIESCYSRRKRLPWRRFALHPPDKNAPESEEEISELVPLPSSPVDNRRRVSPGPTSSGEDTEEEIDRVRLLQSKKQKGDSLKNNSNNDFNDVRNGLFSDGNKENSSNRLIKKKESPKNINEPEGSKKLYSPIKTSKKMFKKNKQIESADATISIGGKRKTIKSKELGINKENKPEENQPMEEQDALSDRCNKPGPSDVFFDMDIYEMDTDVESDSSDSKIYGLPMLPGFYKNVEFFIGQDLSNEERKKVERYILAHKGSIAEKENSAVDYIISRSALEVMRLERCKQPPTARLTRPHLTSSKGTVQNSEG